MKKTKKEIEEEAMRELAEEVRKDFFARQEGRKKFEAQWELNMNFYLGKQHCDVGRNLQIENVENRFFWQESECYNHIAPIVERRLSKLARIRPKMNVFPASNDEKDVKMASVSKKIINSIYSTEDMNQIICEVTRWSELCGTGFYKIMWNASRGDVIGELAGSAPIRSGDVEIAAVSPFEIFPENDGIGTVDGQRSIVHAKAYHVDEIKSRWGVDVKGEGASVYSLGGKETIGQAQEDFALVIERYEAPSIKFPNGRMVMVAGDKVLHVGELPYLNGVGGERVFPFVKQEAIPRAGCFWGASVVERLVPLQKAYNAIKNRKHEFINRLSMGVLAIEDGSIDVEALEEDGLVPGKVVVYRQGAKKPDFVEKEGMPYDFLREEIALVEEFATIGGVSDFNQENYMKQGLSGTALAMMIEQDESKMLMTNDSVKSAIKAVAKQVLRLYKQFVKMPKLAKMVGDNGKMELMYFNASDISADDIIFDTKDEILDSYAQRKEMIFALLDKGVLNDEGDKMSGRMKAKVLENLGWGIWESGPDLKEKHAARATEENFLFLKQVPVKIREIDDDDVHLDEHISFMLSGEFEKLSASGCGLEENVMAHINEHKKQKREKEENK